MTLVNPHRSFRAGYGFPSDFSLSAVGLLFTELKQGPPQPHLVAAPDEWMAALSRIPLLHQPGEAWLERFTSYYRTDPAGGLQLVDAPDGQWSSLPVFPSGAARDGRTDPARSDAGLLAVRGERLTPGRQEESGYATSQHDRPPAGRILGTWAG